MATVVGTDYTKRKKDVLVIVIGTEEEPVEINILSPTKSIHEGLVKVAEDLDKAANGELDEDYNIFDCYEFVAHAMSNNREHRAITPQYLESIGFDMSDIADFIGLYFYFITRLVEGKN